MIPFVILKKFRQIDIRTNRTVSEAFEGGCVLSHL